MRDIARRIRGWYPASIATILAVFALMLVWDAVHYPAGQGIDAARHFKYTETIREEHRLPTREELPVVWHTPPLFHVAAAGIESAWEAVVPFSAAKKRTHSVVQLFSVLAALGVAVLVLLIARELFPGARAAHIAALALAAFSPPLIRTAIMYHGQTLATLLSTTALYVVVRALVRGRLSVRAGLVAGIALGLGVLTRQFVLATAGALCLALAAHYFWTREGHGLRMAAAMAAAVVVLSAPWFVHQQVRYGSAFAQTLQAPDKPLLERQPPEFYLGKPFKTVFTQPYRPSFNNRMPQVLYSDWWGDYFEYFEVPRSLRQSGKLPERYHDPLVRQSYVGVVPTLLMLIGIAGMLVVALRRRSAAVLAIPAMLALAALQGLIFFIGFPVPDSDTMKALYLLSALPPAALAGGWALWRLRERSRLGFAGVLALLVVAAFFDLQFLWLDEFVGRAGQ